MKDNKLIAEFMEVDFTVPYMWRPGATTELTIDHLEYHTSWDWLIPVHKKCMFTEQFTGDDQLRTLLIDAVIDPDIDQLHKSVVEFIKHYNKNHSD